MRIIKEVRLRNFRCYDEFRLDCDKDKTLIVGENGCGKTSVLEAIYLALCGKSFKGNDKEIVKRGRDFYRVDILMNDEKKVIVKYDGVKRCFEIDGKKYLRLPKKNRYPIVLFEPDNLHLLGTSPLKRRDYFDVLIKQIDEKYRVMINKYTKALQQRNDLLKKDGIKQEELFSWNVMCANYGCEIAKKRKKTVDYLNEYMTDYYRNIAHNDDECWIEYIGIDSNKDENWYMNELMRCFEKDKILGYTGFGIHRDDYEFKFNNKKADGSASRGEIRSMILALKFIEAMILEKELRKKPLVLLDDIFSELDEARQKHLVKNFEEYQVIITSTSAPESIIFDRK